jgi:hypothetical protein
LIGNSRTIFTRRAFDHVVRHAERWLGAARARPAEEPVDRILVSHGRPIIGDAQQVLRELANT